MLSLHQSPVYNMKSLANAIIKKIPNIGQYIGIGNISVGFPVNF